MGIEKMELVNIVGEISDLDDVLLKCCESKCFHIEPAINPAEKISGFKLLNTENPYQDALSKVKMLATNLSIPLKRIQSQNLKLKSVAEFDNYISQINEKVTILNKKKQENLALISQYYDTIKQIEHLLGLGSKFERIAARSPILSKLGAETLCKWEFISLAIIFASVVLPNPGGPKSKTWSNVS